MIPPRNQPALAEIAGPGAESEAAQTSAACGSGASDWPFPAEPPFEADDEDEETPDE